MVNNISMSNIKLQHMVTFTQCGEWPIKLVFIESAHWGGGKNKIYAISPFRDTSRNKNIRATIRSGQETQCLPYAG